MSSNPYIGQITLFAGNFEPQGWKYCHGQLLSVSEYQALFSILGTVYGGDGRTTFGLPDLRGRVPLHVGGSSGQGSGLSEYRLGQKVGAETVAITATTMPAHTHDLKAHTKIASSEEPEGNFLAKPDRGIYLDSTSVLVPMNSASIGNYIANGDAHNNLQPFLGLNFIIALIGVYPSRN